MVTRTARSPNFIDVNNAVNGGGPFVGQAQSGDTVIIPPGKVSWGTSDVLIITKDIQLIGAGMDETNAVPNETVATIITVTNPSGACIKTTYEGSTYTSRISGIVFDLTTAGSSYLLTLGGKAYRRRVGGVIVGGLRVDHIRFRASTDVAPFPIGSKAYTVTWAGKNGLAPNDFITGSYDHNFVDFPEGSGGGERNSFACTGSPDNLAPNGVGQWQWEHPYTFGGGDDTELNVLYIEDNIIHRTGFNFGTLGGGGRYVVRHNSSWGAITTHGIDGGNMGPASFELLNNWIWIKSGSIAAHNLRGGAHVLANNRFTTHTQDIATQPYRQQKLSETIGVASGRNFLDENYTGTLDHSVIPLITAGDTFVPIRGGGVYDETNDPRVGSVYAQGTSNNVIKTGPTSFTLVGLNSTGKSANAWKGFTIVDTTYAPAASTGDQGDAGTVKDYASFILTSTASGSNTLITVDSSTFTLANNNNWEIRRIKTFLCNPGGGLLPILSNGKRNSGDTVGGPATGFAYLTANANGKYKYWAGQIPFGHWSKDNLTRDNTDVGWNLATPTIIASAGSVLDLCHQGGLHDDDVPHNKKNDGTGGPYPSVASSNPDLVRVGAHWSAPGYPGEGIAFGEVGCPDTVYGSFAYPNPMVADAPATPHITSVNTAAFTQGTGGTFQVRTADFSGTVTFSKTTSLPGETFPASGTTFNNSGLLTVGAGSAAGTYQFTIHATNGIDSDTQAFTLTIAASPTKVISISGSLAFGDVDINTTAQKEFTITNNGNTDLTISSISYPTGFTGAWSGVIVPGATHLVSVTFSPVAGASYSGTVTVSSDKTSGTNTIAASGTGVTRIIGLSGTLDFGSITIGQTATRQLTISNTGNRTLVINSIAYPEAFSGDFNSGNVTAGGSKIVNVTFSPTAAQAYSDAINITSNKTSGTSTIAVSGTGTASATKIIQLTGSLAFGNVEIGGTVVKPLVITNSGNSTLTVSAVTLPTGYSADWTSGTIASGASQTVNVTFAPVAATTYNGTVTVTSDATGGANTAPVTGTGTASATKIVNLSGDLAFGNVSTGTSVIRILTISNTGTAPLAVSSLTLPTGFSGAYSGSIAPGASQNVNITFSPVANQLYSGTITVISDATSGTNTVAASGTGVAPSTKIIGITGNLVFGNVQKRHSVQRIMTIANTGTTDLTVSAITCPTAFSVDWTSGVITPGATKNVSVTFAPIAVGSFGGNIVVTSNKTAGVDTITCSGTGTNKRQVPFFIVVG